MIESASDNIRDRSAVDFHAEHLPSKISCSHNDQTPAGLSASSLKGYANKTDNQEELVEILPGGVIRRFYHEFRVRHRFVIFVGREFSATTRERLATLAIKAEPVSMNQCFIRR
jgi:hypothetical protein